MRKIRVSPRPDIQQHLETFGLAWHEGYWSEGVGYEFSSQEVDEIESATDTLWEMCFNLVGDIIDDEDTLTRIGIPFDPMVRRVIRNSWERDHETLYGRFDFGWDGNTVKLFEFNADTPTSLLEASAIQWGWFEDHFGKKNGYDQFNSIHEKLIAAWKKVIPRGILNGKPRVHFVHMDDAEDASTIGYLRDTLMQAGFDKSTALWVEELGFSKKGVVDADGETITRLFKLYPWECFFEDFAQNPSGNAYLEALDKVQCIEPAWKVLLSSKGILPLLWERHPGHPHLLESYFQDDSRKLKNYVTKPLFSREGANVEIHAPSLGHTLTTEGGYGDHPKIVQEFFPLLPYEGQYPVLGSWVINGGAAGMGIRESESLVTGNRSRFVPHVIFG